MKKVALAIAVGLIVIGAGETAFAQVRVHTTVWATPRDCSATVGPCWHNSTTFPKMGTWGGNLHVSTGANGATWYRYQCNTPRRWYVNAYNALTGPFCSPDRAPSSGSPQMGYILLRPSINDIGPRRTNGHRTCGR
ncbi:MAG: hypothetical protein AB1696_25820 [Planctomycetota bacterium]